MIICTLAKQLEQRGLSQRRFAAMSGLDKSTVGRLCHDDTWMAMDRWTLGAICQTLGVQPGELLVWEPHR